jgi:hypothetical protein
LLLATVANMLSCFCLVKHYIAQRKASEDETARELDEWLEAHRDELAAVDEKIRRERKKTPLAVIL